MLGLGLVLGLLAGGPAAWAQEELYVVNTVGNSITVYARTATGEALPLRTLAGPATGLAAPLGVFLDAVHDELVVANFGNSVTVYGRTASGNTAPLRTLRGPATGLNQPQGVVADLVHDELIVVNTGDDSIRVYMRTASGDTPALRTLAGPATGLGDPFGAALDLIHDELVVANSFGNSVTVYPRAAGGNTAPLRALTSGPGWGPAGVALDLVHDELVVAAQSSTIMVFARTASGPIVPIRTIAGDATQLCGPSGVIVDLVNGELVTANAFFDCRSVTTYSRTGNGNTAPTRRIAGAQTGLDGPRFLGLATRPPLAAAVLPTSRSVPVGAVATAFAAVVNAGAGPAQTCALMPITAIAATFSFQTTNAQNQLVGTPNTPANILAGGVQHFVFAFTPTAPMAPTEVRLGFACADTNRAQVVTGVNTLLLSAATSPVPDVIAVASTIGNTGIVDIPGPSGTGLFAVGTSNVGVTGTIAVTADTGGVPLPLVLNVCETDSATGACLGPPTPSVTVSYAGGTNRSFAIFAQGTGGIIPFDPAVNRVFVRFNEGAVTSGATSVAVRTQ